MLPTTRISASEDLEAQRVYAKKMSGTRPTLVVADAFIRGIRQLGYKSTATAIDELIDNSIQAGAENVHVVFGYSAKSVAKPDSIAIVDDGHGMDSDMIALAVMWGGTHREAPTAKDRHGMGRFGFGLPSASVSQARCFKVYSKTADGQWFQVTIDLDDITSPKHLGEDGQIFIPEPVQDKLPGGLTDYISEHFETASRRKQGLAHGTVVVLEKLDNLTWVTTSNLERNLLQHFGIIYRNFLRGTNVAVNGKPVEPVDPLFLTPGQRFYDIDEDRATPLDPVDIAVKEKDSKVDLGTIHVRLARFPWTFAREGKTKTKEGKLNPRNEILRENNGIIFVREGRQIDVVTKTPWFGFQTNDRFWKIEVNFPASLDEEFSVTTNKQQIVPSERIWTLLEQAGVKRAIDQMKKDMEEDRAKFDVKLEEKEKRASVQIMEDTESRKPRSPKREEEANRLFKQEVQKRARETNRPPEQIQVELEAEVQGNRYRVAQDRVPGGPFFRVEQIGGQVVLTLNTSHRFYTDVYAGPESTPRLRAALELMLFVIGECKLDTTEERQEFYLEEIQAWSIMLTSKLGELGRSFKVEDLMADKASRQEELNMAVSAAKAE